jgi:hypothetical protein
LTSDEQTRADALLTLASAMIQDEVPQQIGLVTDDVLTMPGTIDETINLPERPVVSVSSVTLDGEALIEGTDWYLQDDAIHRLAVVFTQGLGLARLDAPYLLGSGIGFGWESQTLEITYTHGYETIPGLVKAITLEAVVRVWVNPGSVARESIGNTSTVYDNMRFSPTGLLLTDDERRRLRRFFGTKARSIQIGS